MAIPSDIGVAALRSLRSKRRRRVTEDSPGWRAGNMGNRTGHQGRGYYVNGRQVRGPLRG